MTESTPQFGIFTFATDYTMSPATIAREVEARGFESLWLPEHTHIPASRRSPYPGGGELPKQYSHTHDVFVALTAAAAVTTTLKLATGICLVTEHHPIALAKTVASLDALSNGRVILGIGCGWNAEEMENHGTPYDARWKILRERVLAMRTIWREDEPEYHGEYVDFDPIWSFPKPAQAGGPPILIGANSRWVFERTADYADGWMPIAQFPGRRHAGVDLDEGLTRLRSEFHKAGRDAGSIDATVFGLGPDREHVERLLEMGFNRIVFSVPPGADGKMMALFDRYATVIDGL
ncbi:MAG: putative F420-dependent oxidoreductase, partial [Gammaproteobacteria bacterium]